jgi:hypothetical protein
MEPSREGAIKKSRGYRVSTSKAAHIGQEVDLGIHPGTELPVTPAVIRLAILVHDPAIKSDREGDGPATEVFALTSRSRSLKDFARPKLL